LGGVFGNYLKGISIDDRKSPFDSGAVDLCDFDAFSCAAGKELLVENGGSIGAAETATLANDLVVIAKIRTMARVRSGREINVTGVLSYRMGTDYANYQEEAEGDTYADADLCGFGQVAVGEFRDLRVRNADWLCGVFWRDLEGILAYGDEHPFRLSAIERGNFDAFAYAACGELLVKCGRVDGSGHMFRSVGEGGDGHCDHKSQCDRAKQAGNRSHHGSSSET
jgi:hypothetical protein